MSDDNQLTVPPSFIALFVPPGRVRPVATRDAIAQRYEFCEDLANLLTDQAATHQWRLGVTHSDVLERVLRGLQVDGAPVTPAEALWVVRRLAELLGWKPTDDAS
jgi:hypothetical protein